MKQLEGLMVKDKKDPVFKMKSSLHDLKKYRIMRYEIFDTYIVGLGFLIRKDDHCVWSKKVIDLFIYVVL